MKLLASKLIVSPTGPEMGFLSLSAGINSRLHKLVGILTRCVRSDFANIRTFEITFWKNNGVTMVPVFGSNVNVETRHSWGKSPSSSAKSCIDGPLFCLHILVYLNFWRKKNKMYLQILWNKKVALDIIEQQAQFKFVLNNCSSVGGPSKGKFFLNRCFNSPSALYTFYYYY